MIDVLIKDVATQLNAFEIFSIFKKDGENVFIDSAKESKSLSNYSFIGLNQFLSIQYKNGIVTKNETTYSGDIFDELKIIINQYACINNTDFPFIGGGIGYFAYDLVRDIENLPNVVEEQVDIPSCYFIFYDNIIIVDHKCNKVYVTALGIKNSNKAASIEEIIMKIKNSNPMTYNAFKEIPAQFNSPFTKTSYMEAVEKMRQYIRSGDIYIANMTHTFVSDCFRDSYDVYKILRKINQAPFAAYLPFEDFSIVSSSPERFLKIINGQVETRPIKGTRPRGKDEKEDQKYKAELENSEKDKSELLMIVDLERNDLSKVCKPHSVKVTELFKIEEYTTVFHLVSTILGELKDDMTAIDCIKACFPGGSITGTPKIRAMEIIEALEAVRRNIYTGCVGYLGFDGNTDLNIVIRTILMKDDKAYIGVGGGITWESDPEAEYYETLDKAKALFKSLMLTE